MNPTKPPFDEILLDIVPDKTNRRTPTRLYPNRGKKWTRKENAILRAMKNIAPTDFIDVAVQLGRTTKSVEEHYRLFNKGRRPARKSTSAEMYKLPLKQMKAPVPEDWGADFEIQRADFQNKLDAATKCSNNTEPTATTATREPKLESEMVLFLLDALDKAYSRPRKGWLRRIIGL